MTNLERLDLILKDSLVVKDGTVIPSIIEISPIDSCNRSCSFCPRSDIDTAPKNSVSIGWNLIDKLYKEIPEMGFKGLLTFAGFSEPFLHKDLFLAVGLLSSVCKVDVVTNGDYLTKDKVDTLFKLGLNKLLISVYDEKRLKLIKAYTSHLLEDKVDIRIRFNGFEQTNRAGTIGDILPITTPCYYPSYQLIMDWNGDVLLCPHDWNRRLKFGNFHDKTLWEIWSSPHMVKFRIDSLTKRNDYPCSKCNTNGMMIGESHKEALLAGLK